MKRNEVVDNLVEDLKYKVPNREICRIATKEQLQRIIAEINLDRIFGFIFDNYLEIRIKDIPKDLWFEMIFYVILLVNYNGCPSDYWDEYDLFYCDEDKLTRKLSKIKKILGIKGEITQVDFDKFIEYAKSDKPDF